MPTPSVQSSTVNYHQSREVELWEAGVTFLGRRRTEKFYFQIVGFIEPSLRDHL